MEDILSNCIYRKFVISNLIRACRVRVGRNRGRRASTTTRTILEEASYLTIPRCSCSCSWSSSSSWSWSSSGRQLVGWSFRASQLGEEVKKVTSARRASGDDDDHDHGKRGRERRRLRNDRPGHRLAFVADLSARRWAQHRPAENLFERLPAASPFREPAAERPSRTWVMSAGRVFNMIVRSSQRDMFLV
jgi:hypothetical protein